MRLVGRGVLLVALQATGACFAYRPAATTPGPGAHVRVVFTTATAVTAYPSGRESAARSYPEVLEATGEILAAASDTVALRLGELRTSTGPVPDLDGQVAVLPAARIARIEERRFQAGTTALVGIGALSLAATTFVVLLIVTLVHAAR